jgi:hypothetical protein
VGWSDAGGHWDESALGSFGESITYDPDMTLRRSMMDDVRPALVQSDKKWNWTGNVGGADFLMYKDTSWGNVRRLARVRSLYDAPGPNLTDVSYGGVSTDGRIQGQVRTQLVGTDDLVRAYLHLRYTFLEDVEYSRLAFFQMAADNYGDNLFSRFAYGNADGVLFDGSVPDHGTTGYASEDVRGIELSGDEPWVFLYDNQYTTSSLPEQYADIGFVVREYRLQSGNVVVDTPYINIHRSPTTPGAARAARAARCLPGRCWRPPSSTSCRLRTRAATTARATGSPPCRPRATARRR